MNKHHSRLHEAWPACLPNIIKYAITVLPTPVPAERHTQGRAGRALRQGSSGATIPQGLACAARRGRATAAAAELPPRGLVPKPLTTGLTAA